MKLNFLNFFILKYILEHAKNKFFYFVKKNSYE